MKFLIQFFDEYGIPRNRYGGGSNRYLFQLCYLYIVLRNGSCAVAPKAGWSQSGEQAPFVVVFCSESKVWSDKTNIILIGKEEECRMFQYFVGQGRELYPTALRRARTHKSFALEEIGGEIVAAESLGDRHDVIFQHLVIACLKPEASDAEALALSRAHTVFQPRT